MGFLDELLALVFLVSAGNLALDWLKSWSSGKQDEGLLNARNSDKIGKVSFLESPNQPAITTDSDDTSSKLEERSKPTCLVRSSRHIQYMAQMVREHNSVNSYLHQVWEPSVRSIEYFGQDDADANSLWNAKLQTERVSGIRKYSWSVPHETALNHLAEYGPLLYVSCGKAYWAYLLKEKRIDLIAVNDREETESWIKPAMITSGIQYLKDHQGCADRALFLNRPSCPIDEILSAYRGNIILFISPPIIYDSTTIEKHGWTNMKSVELPSWPGDVNYFKIYQRTASITS